MIDFRREGHEVDRLELERDLLERDKRDTTRDISPLKKAVDAIVIDTTHLSLEEQILRIESIIRERMN